MSGSCNHQKRKKSSKGKHRTCQHNKNTAITGVYIGHGEWEKMDREEIQGEAPNIPSEQAIGIKWLRTLDPDVDMHHRVLEGGYPNRYGAQITSQIQMEFGPAAAVIREL